MGNVCDGRRRLKRTYLVDEQQPDRAEEVKLSCVCVCVYVRAKCEGRSRAAGLASPKALTLSRQSRETASNFSVFLLVVCK